MINKKIIDFVLNNQVSIVLFWLSLFTLNYLVYGLEGYKYVSVIFFVFVLLLIVVFASSIGDKENE